MNKFIAEIGLNHMGNEKVAFKMIEKASKTGVWGITLQVAWESYYDNSKKWKRKLDFKFYKKAKTFLKKKGIKFGLGIYEIKTINDFKNVGIDFWKIISTKFYNDKLIKIALNTKKKVYLSSGIASMKDIKKKSYKFKKLDFIHTTLDKKISENLNAIETMRNQIKKEIAYGLHSKDTNMILAALTLKANPIFFYIKPDNKKKYPDNDHAIILNELKRKIRYYKNFVKILGNGKKNNLKIPQWVFK